jgi:hypothetical protein
MMQVPNHVQEHIDTIAKHEQEFLARRSPAERLGDLTAAIVGNLGFVAASTSTCWICLFLCLEIGMRMTLLADFFSVLHSPELFVV